ncbi:MAG: hypothetical protein NTV06_01225 [candidate division Zixibacteria bacterium]|nr:hypothetical protein [candidate division Zixibacteria bacterium]
MSEKIGIKNMMLRISLVIFLFILSPLAGAADRFSLPDGVYYHRFASSVVGPTSAWINPAAIGYRKDFMTEYLGAYYEGKFLKSWGWATSGDGIAIAYRHLDDFQHQAYDEYIFGVGDQILPNLFGGVSYLHIKNGAGIYRKKHLWNISLSMNNNRKLVTGVVFSNLNRTKNNGRPTGVEQLYSFSYRPSNNLIILSMEISLSSRQSLASAGYNYGIDIMPAKGIFVYANIDNSRNFQCGFKVNLEKEYVGSQSHYDSRGHHKGTTSIVGYQAIPQPSLVVIHKK